MGTDLRRLTAGRALAEVTGSLARTGISNAEFEARVLVEEVLGLCSGQLPLHLEDELAPSRKGRLTRLVNLRLEGMPLQYVLGSWDFYGARFWLARGVLIPRPETEVVVDAVLNRISKDHRGVAVDLGTGTGAIAITVKRERPNLSVVAIDLDPAAVRLARRNARYHGLQLKVVKGDFVSGLPDLPPMSLVVSNPPYIPTLEWKALDRSVRDFESRLALDGGPDGLSGIRAVLRVARQRLARSGLVVVEIGAGQGEKALALAAECGFVSSEILADLAGRERVLVASSNRGDP
jgi:release factor glutamine methyltransferase